MLLPMLEGLSIDPITDMLGFKITNKTELNEDNAKIDLPLFIFEYLRP